ncbi:MerR family transcriptional regulator [Pseudomonas tohonis]|uniref:MerR family transcriptional regulator n=1 Tax=Pseudomonas tohonis TaxID=2725477 RepID=UPI0021DA3EDA|nr:MerR family transcriptional regulator [Pseudomonas tohonis]UXY50795.1 MerR family transcriptional regulator [Pseudomonas tohonis]
MPLKVGELAKRCGLTVRTLHHYDQIGLLRPSARSGSGYRLYGRTDIARLHQIQVLRKLGLSLGEIGTWLDEAPASLSPLIEQQIRQLDREIAHRQRLRERLATLGGQLQSGQEPELSEWLGTLELMNMYDSYFSPGELKELRLYADEARRREWAALVAQVQALIARGVPPQADEAQALSRTWMTMLEADTGANPVLFAKLNAMHEAEPALREETGITPQTMAYVVQAFSETKLAIYQRYLTPEEFAFLKANYGTRMHEWPPLIAEVHQQMESGAPASDPATQALARRWLELFRSYAGDDPATQQKIREALVSEPELRHGSWASDALLDYLRQAMGHLMAARR